MGVIKDIQLTVSSNVRLQPTARADQFGGAEARAVQTLGSAISRTAGAFQEARISDERRQQSREEQAEVSALRAQVSKARADLTVELQETLAKAEPGDSTIAETFQKKVQDRLGALRENVVHDPGKNFLVQAGASIEGDFQRTAFSGQAKLAGEKAVLDNRQAIDNYSVSALNDPASVNSILAEFNGGLNAAFETNPALTRNDVQKLSEQGRENIVKSAVRGWIKVAPQIAKEKLASGEFDGDLSGDLKRQLLGEVSVAENAIQTEARRVQAENTRMKKEKDDNTKESMLEKLDTQSLTTRNVLDSDLDFDDKKEMLAMISSKANAGDRLTTNNDVYLDLFERITLPDTDPSKIFGDKEIFEEFRAGNLSPEARKDLMRMLKDSSSEEGRRRAVRKKGLLQSAKDQLVKRNVFGIAEPDGQERFNAFRAEMQAKVEEFEKANKNVSDLFNPNSKEYLGSLIIQFKATPKESLRNFSKSLRAAPKQGLRFRQIDTPGTKLRKKEGETPAEFLKRVREGSN